MVPENLVNISEFSADNLNPINITQKRPLSITQSLITTFIIFDFMSLYRIAYHHVNHCVRAHTSSFNLNKHCNFHRNNQVAKLGRWIALLFLRFNVNVSADFAAEFVPLGKTKNAFSISSVWVMSWKAD